jgi:hypothetical protein
MEKKDTYRILAQIIFIIGRTLLVLAFFFGITKCIISTYKYNEKQDREWADSYEKAMLAEGQERLEVLKVLDGEHLLRRMGKKETEKSASGKFESNQSYFLFSGGSYTSGTYNEKSITTITFAWKFIDGSYIISKVDLTKVRVVLDDSIKTPTISFCYNLGSRDITKLRMSTMQDMIDDVLSYVVIKCNNKQWPESIEMP